MSLTVIIASKGRPAVLADTLTSLARQSFVPSQVILSVTSPADLPLSVAEGITVVYSEPGLTKQLNQALQHLDAKTEYVLFLDDDVEIAVDYIFKGINFLDKNPETVGFNGLLVKDEFMDRNTAQELLEYENDNESIHPCVCLYGCNMMVRRTALEGYSFDENLPLYSWLFEISFSNYLKSRGKLLYYLGSRLVHLKSPESRIGGKKFGYAQIANPYYLHCKGELLLSECITSFIGKALISNLSKLLRGSPERISGNLIALKDMFLVKISPLRILDIK